MPLALQWFVKCDGMAKHAADMVRDGTVTIRPESHESTWFRWLDNIEDWCVSRQLWWGHRIPAYRVVLNGTPLRDETGEDWLWVTGVTQSQALRRAAALLVRENRATEDDVADGLRGESTSVLHLEQDEDVLDTWFSSALFPLTTLGWPHDPDQVADSSSSPNLNLDPSLSRYYPLSVMETGSDIIFFWVARMAMLCHHFTGVVPFKEVYVCRSTRCPRAW